MIYFRPLVIFILAFLAATQPAHALTIANQPPSVVAPPNSATIVERGGTVTAIDLRKKTLTVDGVKYGLPSKSVPFHLEASKGIESTSELQTGMMIRFNTSRSSASPSDQIEEIWVVDRSRKARAK